MEAKLSERLARVAGDSTLRLTHHGRRSGKPYEVTIWFMVDGDKMFLPTANVNRNWVRNVKAHPQVLLRIGAETFSGEARPLDDVASRDRALELAQRKYWYAIPYFWTARTLTALGMMRDTWGAFEVRLAGA
jgi:deazaflavin-dependent oxidoreductase (nitroreductase family)